MWNNKNSIEDMIIFEDKDILVCHKAAGIAVQNARIGAADMESSLKNYLALKNTETVPYLGVVHRLDQPVSGILVFARTPAAAKNLNQQLQNDQFEKYYQAVVCGALPDSGTLTDYLVKDGRTNTSRICSKNTPGAKKAVLSYEILETSEVTGLSVVQIHLGTGRHHQIRCQLAKMGCPIKGDLKYGSPRSNPDGSICLHARYIRFVHPVSKEPIEVEAPVPPGNLWNGFETI